MVVKLLKYVWVFPATFMGLIAVGLTLLTGGGVRRVSGAIAQPERRARECFAVSAG